MSEIDDLKKATVDSLRQQRMKDLLAHLTKLIDEMDVAIKKERFGKYAWIVGWAIWVGMDYLDMFLHTADTFYLIGSIVYFVSWMISMGYERNRSLAIERYMATIKVLEILGIIDPHTPPGVKNKKPLFSEGIALVKKWATQKKEAQEEIYQPA